MPVKNRLLLFSLVFSIFLHIVFFFTVFIFLDINEKEKKNNKNKKIIYVYILKKNKKTGEITNNKLKIPKSERKGKKFFIKKNKINKLKKVKNKLKKVKRKSVKKNSTLKLKKSKKTLSRELPAQRKKIEKKTEIKKEEDDKKVDKENLRELDKKEKQLEENGKEEFQNINTTDTNNNENKPISINELAGKEEIFELGKKEVSEEELNKDDDIKGYIMALTKYLNQLARRRDLYPPMAKRLKLEGSLIIRFTIKRDGSVDEKSIKIIISSGYNVLDEGAIRIIKKYVPEFVKKYNKYPPRDNFTVEIPITFEIIEQF